MMQEEKIQTLHPQERKKNKSIPRETYEIIKAAILKILQNAEPTHTELLEKLTHDLKNRFNGNINWYAMTVKLDLEARKIIERTKSQPQKYRIKKGSR